MSAAWHPVLPALGRTDNAVFSAIDPRVLLVVPDDGCTDDERTARQSLEFQRRYWSARGRPGAAIVLMDRIGHQTKGARRVYRTEVDVGWISVFALVSSSVFGRAVASVFMGLSPPPVPTHMFPTLEEALSWTRAQHSGDL